MEYTDILAEIGVTPNFEICFESIETLLENKIISIKNIAALKNRVDLYSLCKKTSQKIIKNFIKQGVHFVSRDGIVISPFAKIGQGTVIHGSCEIRRNCVIGINCEIGPNTVIEDSRIGDNCIINASQIYSSTLEDNVRIGPFSHVRPNSYISSGVKIGDFVEIKNSIIGNDTHASHLTYIGDSIVGKRVNFGCGVVTVNFDGKAKHKTRIGDDAFIGCNTNLVAPVEVGAGAYTAAGSTVTDNVPEGALAIARSRQVNKENWTKKKK